MDYALDHKGERIYPGDYVRALVMSGNLYKGESRRVREVGLNNDSLKVNGSVLTHHPSNFEVSGRYHPYHHNGVDKRRPKSKYLTNSEKEAQPMLHVAVKLDRLDSYSTIRESLNSNVESVQSMAETDLSVLKERIRMDISNHPDNRWLILSGNVIGEASAPPVTYRQW